MNFRDIIRTMAEILVFLILIIGVGAVMGVIMVGVFQHQCLEGAYIQTMKNCIASHDFNSSWCQAGWLK
jgi:ABC-type transporter Mla maintaining outer membrane lipid asymmetry permease subunit MlaE